MPCIYAMWEAVVNAFQDNFVDRLKIAQFF